MATLLNAPAEREEAAAARGASSSPPPRRRPRPCSPAMKEAGFNVTHRLRADRDLRPRGRQRMARANGTRCPPPSRRRRRRARACATCRSKRSTCSIPTRWRRCRATARRIGEVMFRGNVVMKGYLKNKTATDEGVRGRLVSFRRSRRDASRRLHPAQGPLQGHHHLGRREHLVDRGGGRALQASRPCRPPPWWRSPTRNGARRRAPSSSSSPAQSATRRRADRVVPRATSPATSARATWCSPSCRRPAPARSRSSSCARWRRRCEGLRAPEAGRRARRQCADLVMRATCLRWCVGVPRRRCSRGDASHSRYADWAGHACVCPSGPPPGPRHINQPVTSEGEMMQGGVSLLSGERLMPVRDTCLGWPAAVGALALFVCCGAAMGQGAPPPPAVSVIPVASRQVTETGEFLGRVTAIDKVDIVARVAGFIEERNFTEGQKVKTGDLLFRLEQATYKAAVEQQRANLAKAKATAVNTALQLQRGQELVRNQNIPQSTLDQRAGRRRRGASRGDAGAGAARPGANQSRLYRDPLAHRWTDRTCHLHRRQPGQSLVRDPGDDRQPGPIYVIFQASERDVLEYSRRIAESADKSRMWSFTSSCPTAATYPHPGLSNFLDVQVDATTDTVAVRAQLPNPDGVLIPGGIVGVTVERGAPRSALTVPQSAVLLDQAGRYVLVVDSAKKRSSCGASRRRSTRGGHRRHERPQGRRAGHRRGHPEGAARADRDGDRRAGKLKRMFSGVFIDRPRLAFVISIVITLAGIIAITRDPDRAVPGYRAAAGAVCWQLPRRRRRSGRADGRPADRAAGQRHRQHALHQSASGSDGSYTLNVTFALGTDPDINTVNVQNRVSLADAAAARGGRRQGLTIRKKILGACCRSSPSSPRRTPTTAVSLATTRPSTSSTRSSAINGVGRSRCSVRSTIRCGSGSTPTG